MARARGKGGRKDRRERRDGAVHQTLEAGLDNLEDEAAALGLVFLAFDCYNKWGRLGPAAESVYTDSPTGSSLPKGAATKQITAKSPEPC